MCHNYWVNEEAISSWISVLADAISAMKGAFVNALRPPIFQMMDETCDPRIRYE